MRHLNRRGISVIEGLVALAIVLVTASAFVGGVSQIQKITRNTFVLSASERQIHSIAENIKAGVDSYQINFDSAVDIDTALPADNLPMAWSNTMAGTRASCAQCPGTYGYVIQPLSDYRGLYQVTLRMTNTAWTEPYRDYVFVVSGK
jgi:hypothetical protein